MTIKMTCAAARLNDSAALDALTSQIPSGEELRHHLRPGYEGSAQRYTAETRSLVTVAADGEIAACYTVSGVSVQEAATITAECEDIDEWSIESFRAAVERALGRQSDRVQ